LQRQGSEPVTKKELGLGSQVPWPVILREEWLVRGLLRLPRGLCRYLAGTNTVHIIYDGIDDLLPYEEQTGFVEGVTDFYRAKAVAVGDTVYLQLRTVAPTYLYTFCSWKHPFDYLVCVEPYNWDWRRNCLRDCVIVALSKLERPASIESVHSAVAAYRDVSLSNVMQVLSFYSPSVFEEVEPGKWSFTVHGQSPVGATCAAQER